MREVEPREVTDTMKRKCPSCGTINVVVAVDVTLHELIKCSHCGAELGRWADLAGMSDNDDLEEADSLSKKA